jgi:hypothetical protein
MKSKIIHVILKTQNFVMQALCRGGDGEPAAATTLAASNLDAVTLGRAPSTGIKTALQPGDSLKTKTLEPGTCRRVTESMLCKVLSIRDEAGRTGAGEKIRAREGGKSYNQGIAIWREQPPWVI